MRPSELKFKRKFSVNPYKELKLKIGQMSMYKDWVNDKRGDPYPIIEKTGDITERIEGARYAVTSENGGKVSRLLCDFMPIYTYEFKIRQADNCNMGFVLKSGDKTVSIMLANGENAVIDAENEHYEYGCNVKTGEEFSVTFRRGGVSLYIRRDARPELICDVSVNALNEFSRQDVTADAKMLLCTEFRGNGSAAYSDVWCYLCGGISHADIKPMKYEDGTPIYENGRFFLTVSSRLEVGCYQSVMSWNPTLCDFRLEGAMLFDTGDGYLCDDVASSVVYDRNAGKWYIWYCSFCHDHVLARAELKGDPRYGIQIIDSKLMPMFSGNDRREFAGVPGDEDPDLCFIDGRWNLAICRIDEDKAYHYYRFVSDDPLDGFTFADRTPTGGKTGGMFTLFENEYYFTCGTDFDSRALYDVYKYDDFSVREHLSYDYDDGGFRGWGSIMGTHVGTRKKYYFITFDRHNASVKYNWSYGNIYVFEAEIR